VRRSRRFFRVNVVVSIVRCASDTCRRPLLLPERHAEAALREKERERYAHVTVSLREFVADRCEPFAPFVHAHARMHACTYVPADTYHAKIRPRTRAHTHTPRDRARARPIAGSSAIIGSFNNESVHRSAEGDCSFVARTIGTERRLTDTRPIGADIRIG